MAEHTLHNMAGKDDIAKVVIMPGDPARAEYIAKNYLEDPVCFNKVRGMLGFTGYYKSKRISVMGSGMGIPSIGIYSHELYDFYDVDVIIRAGSAGTINDKVELGSVILAEGACTNSNYASQFRLNGTYSAIADFEVLKTAYDIAKKSNIKTVVGNVLSSDTFYTDSKENDLDWAKMDVLCVEMESAGLYMNAARAGKKALAILTATDDIKNGLAVSVEQRQEGLIKMIELSLETAAQFA